jgi:hypothetical protein
MRIHEFNMSRLPDCPVIMLIGRRRSGKSVNTMSILHHYKNTCKWGLAFVGSNASIRDYKKCIPSTFIYDQLDWEVLEGVIKRQNEAANRGTPEKIFILIDDLAYSIDIFRHKLIRQLFANGRHLGVTLIITTQYALAVPPMCRGNTDVIFASQEKSVIYRRKLFETFSIVFPNFRKFDKAYTACTVNYETFIMLSCSGNVSDKIEDNVFFFKSMFPLPTFKINPSGRWWRIHGKRHDPEGSMSASGSSEVKKITIAQLKKRRTPPVEEGDVKEEPDLIWVAPKKKQNRFTKTSKPTRGLSRFSHR